VSIEFEEHQRQLLLHRPTSTPAILPLCSLISYSQKPGTMGSHAVRAGAGSSSPPPKSSKPKKEKSSKKRKAVEAVEDTPESTKEGSTEPIAPPAELSEPPSKKRKSSVEEIEVDITAPEPLSKKALRRLKKGKPLPPSKSAADSTPEPEAKTQKKEVEKRSEHGIWIGNLPWSVSKDDLRKFLVDYSDLTEELITRVHMPGPDDKKSANKVEQPKFGKPQHNKGFAYVDFSTAEAVGIAVELSEQLLQGRRVLIKNNKSFEGRPAKTKEETRNEGKPPSKKIFLGNLNFDTTEESLREHFEKCGEIESVKVATFEDSGKCKGYAWIVFEELEAAQHAVRGFVRVEEKDEDASESEDESDSGIDEDEDALKLKTKIKTKIIKKWVNKIKGRPLRMEFAEDAQVRYKKRYSGKKDTDKNLPANSEAVGEGVREERPKARKAEYMLPYGGPQLTGGIVESTGKKTKF
jgi:RNA recognition motif-containing protein